ncbi:hypothetical protein PIB30_073531 [Stylosanthes scabra]|uniref:Integrase catalytic domain-containing protein n=1 Tax=Stylosanthes scabra TaxID=79078 RepID=A0ABU6SPI0_9FABA|nr:hypothetical protein [Stylosanthes scabra]
MLKILGALEAAKNSNQRAISHNSSLAVRQVGNRPSRPIPKSTRPSSESQRIITSNNGTQFTDKRFREFLKGFQIRQQFSSIKHPQESMNKIILNGLKKRLDERKWCWAEELGRSNDPIRNRRKNHRVSAYGPEDIEGKNSDQEKLGGNWEKSYQVDEALRKGSYKAGTTNRMAEMELISEIRKKARGKGIRVPGIRHDEYRS